MAVIRVRQALRLEHAQDQNNRSLAREPETPQIKECVNSDLDAMNDIPRETYSWES